jgi:hypothetical protein
MFLVHQASDVPTHLRRRQDSAGNDQKQAHDGLQGVIIDVNQSEGG